jgi:hypothetical protein
VGVAFDAAPAHTQKSIKTLLAGNFASAEASTEITIGTLPCGYSKREKDILIDCDAERQHAEVAYLLVYCKVQEVTLLVQRITGWRGGDHAGRKPRGMRTGTTVLQS